jgi:hypothetical protein
MSVEIILIRILNFDVKSNRDNIKCIFLQILTITLNHIQKIVLFR